MAGVYNIVNFDTLYNKVNEVTPPDDSKLTFQLSLYLFVKLYGLGFFSVPGVLSAGNNIKIKKYLAMYNKYVKSEEEFRKLQQIYLASDNELKESLRQIYNDYQRQLKAYKESLSPLLTFKKITLTPGAPSYGFQRRNPRYRD